jgi:phage tail sheath protein FI
VSGSASDSSVFTFTVTADSAGTEGNLTKVIIDNDIRSGEFIISVYNDGIQVETWGQLTKDNTSRKYVETLMAVISDYIRVIDNTSNLAAPLAGTYSLVGGGNGIPVDPNDQDTLLIGSTLTTTGMEALSEPEQVDIDLLAVPGHSSTNVILAAIDLCQNKRQDCFFIVDPPFGLSVNEITLWANGRHPLNLNKLDNDFAALYWPWVKIRDTHNRIDVWVPPSGVVLATYVNSDNKSFPWFAPAGETRGVVFNVLDTYTKPTLDERDLMYGNQNCINPIIQFADLANFTIWGQKTMQRRPSALDRVGVRRMLLYAQKLIRRKARALLFEPHDEFLRAQFVIIASAVMDAVKRDRGVYDYFVQCDTELNPPDVVDRNELRAKIGVQPTRAAEFIFVEFSVHKTGTFTENADTF